ncbi:Nuclear pore complex protein NUP58 [Cardamine amara subsp. amara]|uniref:Nuclear pore complex protein NUP58 n=1 Tax=Cardamine amara subsp. amara TaxID=228776 RepID=A0ABD0Z2G6_CARAN
MSFSIFSTPQQQQTPQPQQMFQPQQSGSFFPQSQPQQQTPSFLFQPQQQNQQQTSSFLFQPQQQQLQQQQQQQNQLQQQVQQLYLLTNDKAPANYSTKWADLHPDSQKLLLQIEEKILEYRSESQRLDQCSRLYDSSVSSEGFEFDASRIVQELGGINTAMDRQKAVLQELMIVAKDMLRNAEIAVRSFMMLQPRFPHWKQGGGAVSGGSQPSQAQGTNPAPASSGQQQAITITVQVSDFYRGIPKKPTVFLLQTVLRFEKYLNECRQWVEELEQLLALDSDKYSRHASLLESLPKVMSNVHDFFVHVAAKVESIHQYIESMRTSYLADQRRRGECNDPFLEADRRETAKQEAAAKRVHPTLHLPTSTTSTQSSTQVAGLITSSATPGASNAPLTSAAVPTSNPSSGAGFSFANTPASAPSTSLFATPSSSLFATPSSAAPTSLFGPSTTPAQPSVFGSSSASTFGSAPSLFGQTTPSLGAMPSQFAGTTPGSGASFGSMTKSSRPKSRTTRR